ncbi:MAG: DUF6541 family protein [Frankiaceae bacterium]
MLGGGAIVVGLFGVPWGPVFVLVLTVVGALVGVGIRRTLGPPDAFRPARPSGRWIAIGWTVAAALLGAVPIARGLRRLDRPPQTYDAVFHLNAIRYIEETGKASSLLLGGLNHPAAGRGFYPAGWHVLAATVAESIGADPAAVANAMTLVLGGVVLPAGTALAARALMPAWRWSAAVGAVMGTLFGSLPVLMASYGTLWPNAWATACLPAVLGATVLCLRVASPTAWVALALAGAGMILLHSSSVFAYGLLASPIIFQALIRRWRRLAANGGVRRVVIEVAVPSVVLALGAVVLEHSATFTAVRTYPRQPYESMAQAVGEGLLDAPLSTQAFGIASASWLLGGLVVLGVVHAASDSRQRAWVWSLVFAVGAFAVSAGAPADSFLRGYLTGFWYNDPPRLAGQVPTVAAPLAAVGIWVIARWLGRMFTGTFGLGELGAGPRFARLAGVPILVALALVVTGFGYAHKKTERMAFDYWPDAADHARQLVTPAEEKLLRDLPHLTPPDAVILADPFSGGSLAYALGDRHVVFPHMTGTYPLAATETQQLLPDLGNLQTCADLHTLGVRYLYIDRYHYFDGLAAQAPYVKLDIVPSSGVTLVRRAGTAALYEVTAC